MHVCAFKQVGTRWPNMGYITLKKVENYIFGFGKKLIHISIDIEVNNLVSRRAIDDFQVDERYV